MKALILGIIGLLTIPAHASSLEERWATQETEVISPVTIEGLAVYASISNIARLCSSLGYRRVVDYKAVPCENNERLVNFRPEASVGTIAMIDRESLPLTCTMHSKKLETISCAR